MYVYAPAVSQLNTNIVRTRQDIRRRVLWNGNPSRFFLAFNYLKLINAVEYYCNEGKRAILGNSLQPTWLGGKLSHPDEQF